MLIYSKIRDEKDTSMTKSAATHAIVAFPASILPCDNPRSVFSIIQSLEKISRNLGQFQSNIAEPDVVDFLEILMGAQISEQKILTPNISSVKLNTSRASYILDFYTTDEAAIHELSSLIDTIPTVFTPAVITKMVVVSLPVAIATKLMKFVNAFAIYDEERKLIVFAEDTGAARNLVFKSIWGESLIPTKEALEKVKSGKKPLFWTTPATLKAERSA